VDTRGIGVLATQVRFRSLEGVFETHQGGVTFTVEIRFMLSIKEVTACRASDECKRLALVPYPFASKRSQMDAKEAQTRLMIRLRACWTLRFGLLDCFGVGEKWFLASG
jgi:hypothetical protein